MRLFEDAEFLADFGRFIKDKRELLELSQAETAKRVGISQVYYCHIEQAKRRVDFPLAVRICNTLGLDINIFTKKYK